VSAAGARRRPRSARQALLAGLAAVLVLTGLEAASPAAFAAGAVSRVPQVFLLSSAPDSFVDLQRHGRSVGIVYPTYYDCETPSGALTGTAQAAIGGYTATRGLSVMPRFNCQDGPTVHRILTSPQRRAATLRALSRIATEGSNRGICLDLENDGAEDRQAMSSFVSTLAAMLHAHHRRLTVVVVGVTHEDAARSTGFYDDTAIGAAADRVFVLAWGAHWAGSGPGPIAPLEVVRGIARFIASLPTARRFAIGAPMYALDWPEGGQGEEASGEAVASQYSDVTALARRVGARPRRDAASQELTFRYGAPDGTTHVVWYMDAHAVDSILRISEAAGLGVGLWRLGAEDQRVWSSGIVA
jgi:spore germination protein